MCGEKKNSQGEYSEKEGDTLKQIWNGKETLGRGRQKAPFRRAGPPEEELVKDADRASPSGPHLSRKSPLKSQGPKESQERVNGKESVMQR